jgi:hypothetical protein
MKNYKKVFRLILAVARRIERNSKIILFVLDLLQLEASYMEGYQNELARLLQLHHSMSKRKMEYMYRDRYDCKGFLEV